MPVDELALIQMAQEGDLTAFNRLVLLYQDMAYNVAYRIMNEPPAAEDAVQEAFLNAYMNLLKFRGGSFRAWLMRIVTNTCYDELRRRKRRPTVPLEPVDDSGEEIESPHWMEDPGETPEVYMDRTELNSAIQHCLEGLPAEFRTAVVLVDVQGMDYVEAASVLGKPLGTVKSRLARARLRLRDCLQGFMELLPAIYRLENG